MFQLNSWIPLLSDSSRLAVRNARKIQRQHRMSGNARVPQPKPQSTSATARAPPHRQLSDIQPLEPMLLPKLRIYFADFPWSHCSIDQRLFTSESGCGYRYGLLMRESDLRQGFLEDNQGTERR